MSFIQFPVGPITDPNSGRLSLEWFMFLQSLNNGVAFAIDQAQAAARFSSGMLGTDSEGDTETTSAMIPGPQGATGAKGLFVPGMDGQDGEDLSAMQPPGIGGNNADMNTGVVKSYMDFIAQGTNPPAPPAGMVRFHSATTQGFTRFEQDNEAPTNLVVCRDNVFIAKNTTGSSMPAMTPVYRTGATGNVPNIGLAKADSITTLPAIGLTLDTIGAGNFGQVMKLGIMQNVNTNAFGATDELWVSATTAGTLTNVRPVYPNLVQRMAGVLVKGVGNGSLEVVTAPFIGGLESGTTATGYTFAGTVNATGLITGTGGAKLNSNAAALPAPPTGTLLQIGAADGNSTVVSVENFNSASGPIFIGRTANTSAASPSATASGDVLLTIGGRGYGSTGYAAASKAVISLKATQAWTDANQGTQILFRTTPNNSTTLTTALTLDQDQSATFASTVNAVGVYQANGTSGVASFGPSAVTSITVKNGIITAIS